MLLFAKTPASLLWSLVRCRYTEDTSVWTLDYPPLFAWFERLLAIPAALYHPAMLHLSRLPYESPECILFQVGRGLWAPNLHLSGWYMW